MTTHTRAYVWNPQTRQLEPTQQFNVETEVTKVIDSGILTPDYWHGGLTSVVIHWEDVNPPERSLLKTFIGIDIPRVINQK